MQGQLKLYVYTVYNRAAPGLAKKRLGGLRLNMDLAALLASVVKKLSAEDAACAGLV